MRTDKELKAASQPESLARTQDSDTDTRENNYKCVCTECGIYGKVKQSK